MKGVKIALYTIALLLFVSNYAICDFFYYNNEIKDIKSWWGLKSNIYAIIMSVIFCASLINSKGIIRFVLILGVFFSIGNIIDKVFFNVLDFTLFDILLTIVAFLFAAYDYHKIKK